MNRTLSQLVVQLGIQLRDNYSSTSTLGASGANKNQLIDESLKGGSDNKWVGSEVLFTGPNLPAGENPKQVLAFKGDTGTLTLDSDWNTSVGVPAGQPYTMIRLRGRGVPFEYRVAALEYAINSINEQDTILASPTLYTSINSLYPVPAGVDSVYNVYIGNTLVPLRSWKMWPGGFLQLLNAFTGEGATVYLHGRYTPNFSYNLDSVYSVTNGVIQDATEYLIQVSQRPNEQTAANRGFQERMRRTAGNYRRPSERKVLR